MRIPGPSPSPRHWDVERRKGTAARKGRITIHPLELHTASQSPRYRNHNSQPVVIISKQFCRSGSGPIRLLWRPPPLSSCSRPARVLYVMRGEVHFGTDMGSFIAVHQQNGSLQWQVDTGGRIRSSPIAPWTDTLRFKISLFRSWRASFTLVPWPWLG